MRVWIFALLLLASASTATARPPDRLAEARRLYNLGQFDQALEVARQAAATPATQSSGRLIIGRIRLERYRKDPQPDELNAARSDFHAVDARALDARERVELQVGLAELLYFDEHFGAAAELLDPVIDSSAATAPDAHDRAIEWWASSLDRQAQLSPPADRAAVYSRIIQRMEVELRRDPTQPSASYWLAAAARGTGDLDRAWSAASAAWIRATMRPEKAAVLRADIERLITQVVIPERAAKAPARERKAITDKLTADWEAFKKSW
jgi:hypothetical protein